MNISFLDDLLKHNFIVNLAPTGMVPTAAMTPHVPLTPQDIAQDIAACTFLGVTVVHLHARDRDGRPTSSKHICQHFIEAVREVSGDVVICVSCSGREEPDFNARSQVLDIDGTFKPDLASLTLSSLNFPHSASTNSPETIIRLAERMRERNIKPELEVFDLGMMNYAHYLIDKGHIDPPFYFNFILGGIASAQADLIHLGAMLREMPEGSLWTVGGIGNAQLPANLLGLSQGGGVRVGLEDNIWFDTDRSKLARNADQISRIEKIGCLMGKQIMRPKEFRQALGLTST